jgi:hypothetical protein
MAVGKSKVQHCPLLKIRVTRIREKSEKAGSKTRLLAQKQGFCSLKRKITGWELTCHGVVLEVAASVNDD